ncbi:MAG: DinB family protein [Saprospiraceae bacterium]|nr:DinB family protein [Saprospiraceae bacterium]
MQIRQDLLIDELLALTEKAIESANTFKKLPLRELNFKKTSEEWSILECIEHLNLYGDFYLPEIENQLLKSTTKSNNLIFKSGILGNYFANLMKANNGKITKMKSPKDKNPSNSELSILTIERFIKQLEKLKSLLQQSRTVDLTKLKAAISLTKFIKLRLGDTFRFLIYHIERHILQAQRNMTS